MQREDALIHTCDVDSHEQVPMNLWVEEFGPGASDIQKLLEGLERRIVGLGRPDLSGDEAQISEDTVWHLKGSDAPSAIDLTRRAGVLDAMGIQRQLVFPTMALGAEILVNDADAHNHFRFNPGDIDVQQAGRNALASYNSWAVRLAGRIDSDRIRMVGMVLSDSRDALLREAESLMASGIRAISLASGKAPADTSPADPDLDAFWAMVEDADIPVLLHLGGEHGFVSPDWHRNVEEFAFGENSSLEFPVEPFRASIMNIAPETFIAAMIMGGVFEAHPRLRLGVIECGATWLGPFAERLDMWSDQFTKRLKKLRDKPSRYIARNVRVTPYYFEPVSSYFERWPDLSDVYCYSSDYPHREGGQASKQRFYEELSGKGDDVVEKFFVANGSYLLP